MALSVTRVVSVSLGLSERRRNFRFSPFFLFYLNSSGHILTGVLLVLGCEIQLEFVPLQCLHFHWQVELKSQESCQKYVKALSKIYIIIKIQRQYGKWRCQ